MSKALQGWRRKDREEEMEEEEEDKDKEMEEGSARYDCPNRNYCQTIAFCAGWAGTVLLLCPAAR